MSQTRNTPTRVLMLSLVALLACHDNPASPDIFSIQPAPTMSGDGQRDTVLATLAPLRVLVLENGRPAIGVHVHWTVAHDSTSDAPITSTDPSGIASLSLPLGSKPTVYRVFAALVTAGQGSSPVAFTVTTVPGNPAAIRVVSGTGQTDTVTATLRAD